MVRYRVANFTLFARRTFNVASLFTGAFAFNNNYNRALFRA